MQKYKRLVVVLSIFLLMSMVCISIPWHSGYVFSGDDLRFHINRIKEISMGGDTTR